MCVCVCVCVCVRLCVCIICHCILVWWAYVYVHACRDVYVSAWSMREIGVLNWFNDYVRTIG